MAKIISNKIDLSTVKDNTVVKSEDKIVTYEVVEKIVFLKDLERERDDILQELSIPEPTVEELVEIGKTIHPYYLANKDVLQERLEELNSKLK